MAQMTNGDLQRRVEQVLRDGLSELDIDAQVDVEPVAQSRLVRVFVVSDQRDSLSPTEWDRTLARLVRDRIGPEAESRIGMIYTVTPGEMEKFRAEE